MIHEKLNERIHVLKFPTIKELLTTFIRFQEHYESPEFKGKYFTLKEFKNWYTKNSQRGRKLKKFTYYSDWSGCNIPSHILKPFYDGHFNPLTKREKELLKVFEDIKDTEFYIIGLTNEVDSVTLKHETAHGLFYLEPKYAKKVQKIIAKYDTLKMSEKLRAMGYERDVIVDEINAYSVDKDSASWLPLPIKMIEKLTKLYEEYNV